MPIDGTRLGLAMDMHVGDLRQPPGRDLIQVFQGMKAATTKQAGFNISKWPLDFPFGLGPSGLAGDWPEAVMGRERQEPWVVHRLVAVGVAAHHDFHVVIKTGCRDSAQVFESADVLAQRGGEILAFDEMEILPERVAQDVAEGVNPGTVPRS